MVCWPQKCDSSWCDGSCVVVLLEGPVKRAAQAEVCGSRKVGAKESVRKAAQVLQSLGLPSGLQAGEFVAEQGKAQGLSREKLLFLSCWFFLHHSCCMGGPSLQSKEAKTHVGLHVPVFLGEDGAVWTNRPGENGADSFLCGCIPQEAGGKKDGRRNPA